MTGRRVVAVSADEFLERAGRAAEAGSAWPCRAPGCERVLLSERAFVLHAVSHLYDHLSPPESWVDETKQRSGRQRTSLVSETLEKRVLARIRANPDRPYREIGAEFGLPNWTVSKIARAAGIKRGQGNHVGGTGPRRQPNLKPERNAEILGLAREGELTQQEIAEKFGVTRARIGQITRRAGIRGRPGRRKK